MSSTRLTLAYLLAFVLCATAWRPTWGLQSTLAWDAATDTSTTGFRLYQSTFSMLTVSTGSAFADPAVKKWPVVASTQTISGLASGGTTYYRLTALNSAGVESGFNVDDAGVSTEVAHFVKRGDITQDGNVNIVDVNFLVVDWLTNGARSDTNNDGKVNIVDANDVIVGWGQ